MLKKFNTTTLLVILAVLIALVFLTKIFDDKKGGRTFREELVNVDTSLVDKILLYPQANQGKEIRIVKEGSLWSVQGEGVSYEADSSYIRNLLGTFSLIKPQRLAATDKSRWKDFNVDDSLGTKLEFYSGEKNVMGMVVGKFSYNQMSRSGISYLRLLEDDDVYAVDGFIPMSVNQPFNEWRNKNVLRTNKEDLTKISFSYPDSSFVLAKQNGKWIIENAEVDSGRIDKYISDISFISNSSFVDNYSAASTPAFWVTIEGNNMPGPVVIKAFAADSANQFFIHSSYNPKAWFSSAKGNLAGRIFKKLTDFMAEAPAAGEK